MDEQIAFLGARLDEDEARANALLEVARYAAKTVKEPRLLGREIPGWHSWADVEAMCTRVLQEVAAKRAIIALCAASAAGSTACTHHQWAKLGLSVIRRLAAVYSGHPDYQPERAP